MSRRRINIYTDTWCTKLKENELLSKLCLRDLGDGKDGWDLFTATDADAICVVTNLIGTKVR